MTKRRFGSTNIDIPVIGQGTWMIEGNNDRYAHNLAIESLRLGLELGMTHIDTAEMYGNGVVEEMVRQAIMGRRDEVFIASKVLPSNASYYGTLKACERSLKRLNTDRLDLYLIHWPSSEHPIHETMRAMEKLVKEGLVRLIGVSNFDLEELKEAEHALQDETIACNQVLYHLNSRGIERKLLPYCHSKKIAVVGYAPFGHGNFPSSNSVKGRLLVEIAERHRKTPHQVVLNFIVNHTKIFTIPKTSKPERVKENGESVGWNLTEDEIADINRIFPVPAYDVPLDMI
ncbi:aldo/keto reductase [Candidatus Nitrosocosmicus arcticus]|uniref:Aldo/keto reductase n=1 Tax=Candidatus Nitrosocosmicus arcticus TaxID=2035267 RepID=A0A557SVU0_9ARCH|nr:aldo/keto reductase [Candidatus Nitrosocosmicus arcticus]TVP40727.1 Aldo/keto reductase [Candidatus Nitrosocosmicus arcticus]